MSDNYDEMLKDVFQGLEDWRRRRRVYPAQRPKPNRLQQNLSGLYTKTCPFCDQPYGWKYPVRRSRGHFLGTKDPRGYNVRRHWVYMCEGCNQAQSSRSLLSWYNDLRLAEDTRAQNAWAVITTLFSKGLSIQEL